jgi:hypothetical protein
MPTPAQIVRSCLLDLFPGQILLPGTATVPGAPPLPGVDPRVYCFVSSWSDSYDRAILLKDMKGMDTGREMRPPYKRHSHPGIAILVRDVIGNFQGSFNIAETLALAFDEQFINLITTAPEDNNQYSVAAVKRTSTIADLGEEPGKQRQLWSFNIRVSLGYNNAFLG